MILASYFVGRDRAGVPSQLVVQDVLPFEAEVDDLDLCVELTSLQQFGSDGRDFVISYRIPHGSEDGPEGMEITSVVMLDLPSDVSAMLERGGQLTIKDVIRDVQITPVMNKLQAA